VRRNSDGQPGLSPRTWQRFCLGEGAHLKILLVTGIFPPDVGGASVVYHQLGLHLGPEMRVLAPTLEGPSRQSDVGHDFEIYRVPFLEPKKRAGRCGPLRMGLDMFQRVVVSRASIGAGLIRHLWRANPDVVCLCQPALYWAAALVRRFSRAPVMFYIHGEEIALVDAAEVKRIAGRLGGFFYQRMIRGLRKADAIVTVGRYGATNLVKIGVAEQRIRVVHNGIDHSRFAAGERDPNVAARHGLLGKRVLFTVSRLDPRKGHDIVIRAMHAILKSVPNAVYLIVGDGPERVRLEALVESLSLRSHVIFAGRVPDDELCAYYRSGDLFVHPNRTMPDGDTEGFGLVFLEAGACGKPVIGGNVGGVPEAVVHGTTGLLVNGESHTEVADAAVRILCDPELAERFGANGRDWAARFSWEATARNFRNLCAELARPSSAAPAAPQRRPAESWNSASP
jgi:phosphatidyl-myo-inositol dimannoside synthase